MTTHAHTHDTPVLGFWLYLMSDCILFAGLFATYAVLTGETFGGPTPRDLANLPFVLGETMLLLASSMTAGFALLFARRHRRTLALGALAITFALGASFLALEMSEFRHLISEGYGPAYSAYLSAFFTLVGTHGAHVMAGLLWMMVVAAHLAIKGTTAGSLRKLTALTLFWHFLDIVWICIFTFVYLFGALSL